jgi:DNA-binding NarL/FixJ family response regulator
MASENAEQTITVLVGERRRLWRETVRDALHAEACIQVVGEAADGAAASTEITRLRPDVALLDHAFAGPSGVELCQALKTSESRTCVILLCGTPDESRLIAALEAGADGCATEDTSLVDLIGAVRQVHSGQAFIPPGMLSLVLHGLIRRNREADAVIERFSRLSRREKEVFALLVEGHDHEVIATQLVVSPHTARTHIQNVLRKLEVHSRVKAAALAEEYQLLERFALDREDQP